METTPTQKCSAERKTNIVSTTLDVVLDQATSFLPRRSTIAKGQNTYAKRKREMEKKEKAEAKRARRNQRKLKLEINANHTEGVQDLEVKAPEADSTNSADSSK